jgi:general secretion pathway protein N
MKRALILALALIAGLILWWPLRLALPAGLVAAEVDGRLWQGRISDAKAGGVALGDVDLALAGAELLHGRLAWRLQGPRVAGLAWRSLASMGVDGLDARLDLAGASPLPLGEASLSGVQLAMAGGRCTMAQGSVVLATAVPGGPLQGALACRDGTLLLPLVSADGRNKLDFSLRDGRWRAQVALGAIAAEQRAAWQAAGFALADGALTRTLEGTW